MEISFMAAANEVKRRSEISPKERRKVAIFIGTF